MICMSYLEETLRALGASDAQLKSSTAKLFERAMIEDSEFCQKVTADAMERIAKEYENAERTADWMNAKCENAISLAKATGEALLREINRESDRLASESKRLETLKKETKDFIYDAELNEAVKAYRAVLAATKEIFGEYIQGEVNQAAIVAAINAGSYVAWRGMMGPNDEKTKEKNTRRPL